ncbi:MAG: hypothetical protein WDZ72_04825 [Cyclobacteriaceae bacterium]
MHWSSHLLSIDMFEYLSAIILYFFIISGCVASTDVTIYGVGEGKSDLFIWLKSEGFNLEIYPDLERAVNEIPASAVLLILADNYPEERVTVTQGLMEMMETKGIRFYFEYPKMVPGLDLSQEGKVSGSLPISQ